MICFAAAFVSMRQLAINGALSGIDTVSILIEDSPAFKDGTINKNEVKTKVELKLREAGIKIKQDPVSFFQGTRLVPVIYVAIHWLQSDSTQSRYAFSLDTECYTYAKVPFNELVLAQLRLWSDGSIHTGVRYALNMDVVDEVGREMEDFCNQFLKDNPKQSTIVTHREAH